MELKARFGKYKAKEADAYVAALVKAHEAQTAAYEETVREQKETIARLEKEIEEYRARESAIASVMLKATQHAKEIEEEYRKRADESDEACRRLHREWVDGMQSAAANLNKLRDEAKAMLEQIDGQFNSLCSWANTRLESLEQTSLPVSREENEASLEMEIAAGAGADLGEECRELGIEGAADGENTDEKKT